jgi:pilus assembly protein CpaB
VLATGASLLAYDYLKKQASKQSQGVGIVCALADLAVGTKLDATNVKLMTWPKENLPQGCLTDARAAMGRVTVRQLSAGDIVTDQKLLPVNAGANSGVMTYIVPQGHRAVTVAVNEVAGVAGFITPNNRVDIVLISPLPGDKEKDDNMSKIILQNVPVLATGQVTMQKDDKPTVVPTVTLDLAPDDAEKLCAGAKKGTIQLLLRNIVDIASVSTHGATIANMLGHGERIAPVKNKTAPHKKVQLASAPPLPQGKYTVEIIKGGNKTTREFSEE